MFKLHVIRHVREQNQMDKKKMSEPTERIPIAQAHKENTSFDCVRQTECNYKYPSQSESATINL